MSRGATAVAEEEQTEMFEELNKTDPKHKAVLAAAKLFHKKKQARDEMKNEAKHEEDTAMEKLIALMHEADLKKFKYEGLIVELLPTKERAKVKLVVEDDDEDPAEDPDE